MSELKPTERQITIQRIYIKDVSLETPNSPQIFREAVSPEVDFNLGTEAKTLEENLFEVTLGVTVTVKSESYLAYLEQFKQAGN